MDLLSIVGGLKNVKDLEDMKKLIECPVCLDIPLPPIYLCQRGHIVCNACQEKTVLCPLCREPFSNTRSFVAEGIVEKCTMRCKFSDQGCPVILSGDLIMSHLKTCPYRPLRCVDCGGKWINFGDYPDHLLEVHKVNGKEVPEGHVVYTMSFNAMVLSGKNKYIWPPFYFKAFGHTFYIRVNCIKNSICAYVYGHEDPAHFKKLEAIIELYLSFPNKDFKLTWKGQINQSRDDPYSDVLVHGRGLILPTETIRKLAVTDPPDSLPEWCYYVKIQEIDATGQKKHPNVLKSAPINNNAEQNLEPIKKQVRITRGSRNQRLLKSNNQNPNYYPDLSRETLHGPSQNFELSEDEE